MHPIRQNNRQLVQQYKSILRNVAGIEVFPLDINILEYAAQFKRKAYLTFKLKKITENYDNK